jgi:hypothetical protein
LAAEQSYAKTDGGRRTRRERSIGDDIDFMVFYVTFFQFEWLSALNQPRSFVTNERHEKSRI